MAGDEPHPPAADAGNPPRTTIEDHQQTYGAFITITKWSIGICVLILVGMAVFLL
ncbi:MAG: aa3-type cytochrome c oxidase subunit IV [Pseudomonadota bacterium]